MRDLQAKLSIYIYIYKYIYIYICMYVCIFIYQCGGPVLERLVLLTTLKMDLTAFADVWPRATGNGDRHRPVQKSGNFLPQKLYGTLMEEEAAVIFLSAVYRNS